MRHAVAKIDASVSTNAELARKQPWKAVAERDHKWLGDVMTKHYNGDDSDLKLMAGGLLAAYTDSSVEAFAEKAEHFLRTQHNEALKRQHLRSVT